MTESPFPHPAVRELARELTRLRSRIAVLEGGIATSGAGMSSLDGAPLIVKDTTGTVRQVVGPQGDGTYTSVDVNGPVPATPVDPVVTAVPGGFKVGYSGAFVGGVARPSDLKVVEVHVDQDPLFEVSDATVDAAFSVGGTIPFATDDYVPHTVRLVARSTSNVRSAPSGAVTVTPLQLGPGDIAPGGIGTVNLDDGAVTPPKSGTGVTQNLVPDAGFNEAGWRAKRAVAPWGFVVADSVGFIGADWAAYCPPTTTRAELLGTGSGNVPVIPDEVYFVAYDAGRSSSGAGQFALEISYRDSSGTLLTEVTEEAVDPLLAEVRDISSLPTSTFETRHGQITVPPNAATMRVVMVRQDEVGTSAGNLYIDRLEVRSVLTRATAGQRVETSPSGVLVFGANGDPIGSITADGSISMVTGQFDSSLIYGGTEMSELLNQRARGEVARVDAGYGQTPATTSEIVWLEFEFEAEQGRAYKLRSGGLVARGTGTQGIRIRYTTDGTRPLVTSPVLIAQQVTAGQTLALNSDIGALADAGNIERVRFAVCVRSVDATSAFFDPSDLALGFSAWVEDVGPRQDPSGGIVNGGTTGGSGSGGTTTPTPTKKTFTSSWNCTWSQSWVAGNTTRSDDANRMWQGYTPAAASRGDQVGLFGFNMTDIRAKLAGATIKKVELYLYAEHWYYNAGGTVMLGTAAPTSPPGSFPATAGRRVSWRLGKPEGRWVDLGGVGITIGNQIRDNQVGCFALEPRPYDRNLDYYGYFKGFTGISGDNSPGLRITYEKAV